MQKSVTAVIVTYHSRNTVGHALQSLQESVVDSFADCIVVDNASSDGTADYVATTFPWATLIHSPGNLGFGRGCNLGVASVKTPYTLFLNPDASIDPQSLSKLVDFMDAHPKAGIVGPATFETTARVFQPIGLLLTPLGLIRETLRKSSAYPQRHILKSGEQPFRTNWVCGSSMLVRTSMLHELDGFDPRFFLYFEETDLCLRAARADYEIWANGECTANHIGGASAKESGEELTDNVSGGSIADHYYRSRFYYLGKNFGWFAAVASESLARSIDLLRSTAKKILRAGQKTAQDANRPFLKLPEKVEK